MFKGEKSKMREEGALPESMEKNDGGIDDDRRTELRRTEERGTVQAEEYRRMRERSKSENPRPQNLFKGDEAKILTVRS